CRAAEQRNELPSPHGALKPRTTPYHILEWEDCASQQTWALDVRYGSATAVSSASGLGLLLLDDPTLAMRIGTSGPCHERTSLNADQEKIRFARNVDQYGFWPETVTRWP